MNKRLMALLMVALLAVIPANSVSAACPEESENQGCVMTEDESLPTLELIEDVDDGTWTVIVKDTEGNIITENSDLVGNSEDVVAETYNSLMSSGVIASCTHIPCSNSQVLGGINHIIRGSTCTMVRYKFYKCNCCGAIIGMVPNSAVVVGTHPAH